MTKHRRVDLELRFSSLIAGTFTFQTDFSQMDPYEGIMVLEESKSLLE